MIKRPLYGGTTIGGNSYRKGQYIHECIYERMVDLRRVLEDIKVVRDEGHSIGASAYTPKTSGGRGRSVVGIERDDGANDGTEGLVPSLGQNLTPTPYCLWVPCRSA